MVTPTGGWFNILSNKTKGQPQGIAPTDITTSSTKP
jgi:hypothetical protein